MCNLSEEDVYAERFWGMNIWQQAKSIKEYLGSRFPLSSAHQSPFCPSFTLRRDPRARCRNAASTTIFIAAIGTPKQ